MEKRVFLSRCEDYRIDLVIKSVRDILAAFGGAEGLAAQYGKKVLLKPNLVLAAKPENGATTHPAVMQAISEEFVACGCQVIIADSPGGPYNPAYLKHTYHVCGMDQAAEASGAVLNFDCEANDVAFPEGVLCQSFPIIKPILEADLIISVGKMKTHGLAYVTGSVKNLFGAIPGLTKPAYHSKFPDRVEFCRMLVDVCECVKPGFAFVDGIIGMEGRGPVGGTPKPLGLLLGGINPHAVDMAACHAMGIAPEKAGTIAEAISRGLIPQKVAELEYLGAPEDRIVSSFIPPIKATSIPIHYMPKFMQPLLTAMFIPYPVIETAKCVGCGACAQSCPQKIIRMENRKAVIDYNSCIKCYCCHEFCYTKAIEFSRFVKKK